MPDGDSFPLFCSRGVRFVGTCPPKRTVNAFLSCKKRTLTKNPPQGNSLRGIFMGFSGPSLQKGPYSTPLRVERRGGLQAARAIAWLPQRSRAGYPRPLPPPPHTNWFSTQKRHGPLTVPFSLEFLRFLLCKEGTSNPPGPCYRQMEMITGTNKEQIMPLSTDSTTVSSLVYFSIMGRVVSSLVAPAGAMLV